MKSCFYPLIAFVLFYLFISTSMHGQCPITVDAGPNKFVCAPGQSVELDADIAGSYLAVRWTPATGLSNPNVLNPTATVNSTVTYTLTGAAFDPSAPNLFVNPDFELGNTGFTTSLSYNPTPITPGTYTLTTSPALVLSFFPPCDDHTFGNGTGNLMLVNGTGTPNPQVWCQTVPVTPNSWYFLSAWTTISPVSPPTFQFAVNNTPVGTPFSPPNSGCDWQEFTAVWFSGAATTANVCIRNLNTAGNGFFGDDFGLDDIFMSKACTVTDQVTVSVATVNAVLPATIILSCNAMQNGIQLNGSGSSQGPGYSYSWDGPGIIGGQNTPIATVNEPGVYTLTVAFDTGDGFCTKSASITVLPDPNMVEAVATGGEELTCFQPTTMLDGTGSTVRPLVTYNWQPSAGVVSGQGTLTPTVNQGGIYTLTVTHGPSGCTATAEVEVTQNNTLPTAVANTPGPIPCQPGTITLNGTGSSIGPDFTYQWAGPGIVSGETTLNNCVVNAPGFYTLVVTNETNGCTRQASVAVTQSGMLPVAEANAEAPGILNCFSPSLQLNSAGSSSGPNYTYEWSTPNGQFNGPVNGPTATVDTIGLYILTVTNTQNGCRKSDTVSVAGDVTPPKIVIAKPLPTLNCVADSVRINAGQSSNGPEFSYVWTTPNGHFLSGDSTLMPWVDSAGVYIISGFNAANGCKSVDTARILLDTLSPMVNIAPPASINCLADTVLLDASGSSNGPRIVRSWLFTPGTGGGGSGFVSGDTTLMPVVNAPGTYTLTLIDTLNQCISRDSVEVLEDVTPPVANAGPDENLDCISSSVILDASGSSQGPAFSYLWTGGDTTLMLTVYSPGTYALTVTNNENGCAATDSTVVIQLSNMTLQVDQQVNISCFGSGDGVLGVVAGGGDGQYTYQWSSGQQTPAINNLEAGTYILTVTDGDNCSVSISLEIQEPGLLSANAVATPVTTPGGSDGTAAADPAGGTAPYNFIWSTGQTEQSINGLGEGTYTVTVTDANGCTAAQTVEVTDNNCNLSAVLEISRPRCFSSSDGSVTAVVSGGALPLSYHWYPGGAQTMTIDSLSAGYYAVTITDANGCEFFAETAFKEPPVLIVGVSNLINTTCPNVPGGSASAEAIGGTGDISIVWSNGQEGPLATNLTAGMYTVTATDANGCTDTVQAVILADDQEPPLIQGGVAQLPLGVAGMVNLTIQNLNLTITDNCALSTVEFVPAGFDCTKIGMQQVTVTATDSSGNSNSVNLTIEIVDQQAPTLSCPASVTRCAGNDVVIYNAPVAVDNCLLLGGQFALIEGLPSGSQFPEGVTTTTYTYTDASGNVGSCSFQVTILSPLEVVLDSIIQDVGSQNTGGILVSVSGSQPSYVYEWQQNGQPVATTEDLTGVGAGVYQLKVTDTNGCTLLAGPFEVSNSVSTTSPDWSEMVKVYPNPTSGIVYVALPDELLNTGVQIVTFDMLGRKMQEQHTISRKQIVMDWSGYTDGLYTIAILSEWGRGVYKVILNR